MSNTTTGAEWLARRRKGIGGSDVGPILGLSPWGSAHDVWLDKTSPPGEAPERELTDAMDWGQRLEPAVAAWWAEQEGAQIRKGEFQACEAPEDYLVASPDYYYRLPDGESGVLEIKTASAWTAGRWGEVPDHVMLQIQHYLYVLGAQHGAVAVLVGGQKPLRFRVERDDALLAVVLPALRTFWTEHVLARVPPPPDGSAGSGRALAALYPQASRAEPLVLDGDAADMAALYLGAKATVGAAERQADEAKQRLMALMGEHAEAVCGRYRVKWSNVAGRRTLDSKALAKDHPSIATAYTKEGAPSRRFQITEE